MGIGKSLKKFVKKALPVAAAVAPFIPGMQAFAPILGAAAGGAKGGLKGALLGGLGGYAAGQFGQGFMNAPGSVFGVGRQMAAPTFMQRLSGGLAGLKTGFGMGPQGGITNLINRFTGAAQPAMGAQPELAHASMKPRVGGGGIGGYVPTQTNYLGTQTATPWAGPDRHGGVMQYLDQAKDAATGKFSGMPATLGGPSFDDASLGKASISDAINTYVGATGNEGTKSGFMDFVKGAFSEQNRPLTLGLLGAAAQMWENKENEGAGDVAWGEGLDYNTGRGESLFEPVSNPNPTLTLNAANGGRIGFADGDEVRDAEYEGWKQMYEKNPEVAMMMHGNSAEYLKRYEIEMMPIDNKARGGIIGLANGGEPTHEMDLRGGGFIPVGAYERADDVPARVSKNEFVMTADAVRAAGGGSVNRGSQRMYDLMNSLEARA